MFVKEFFRKVGHFCNIDGILGTLKSSSGIFVPCGNIAGVLEGIRSAGGTGRLFRNWAVITANGSS
jgi:hypothetical protein